MSHRQLWRNNYPMQILMQSEGESKTLTLTLQVYDGVGLQLPSYRKFTLTGREPQVRALITALVFANGARVSAGVVSVDVSGEGLPPVFGVSLSDGTNGEARAIINALPTPGFDRPRTATAIFAGYSTIPGRHAQEAAQLATTRFSLTLRLLPRVRPLQISIIPAVASITGTVLFTASSSGGWVSEPLGYSVEVFGSKFDRQVGGVEPEEGARGVSVFYVFGAGDITITAALDDDLDTTSPTSTTITIHRRAIGTYRISAGIRLPQLFAPRYVTNDVSRTITRFVDVELLRPVRGAAVVPLAQVNAIYAGRHGFAALDPDNSTVYASSGLAPSLVPYLRPVRIFMTARNGGSSTGYSLLAAYRAFAR